VEPVCNLGTHFWLQVCGGNPQSLINCVGYLAEGERLEKGGWVCGHPPMLCLKRGHGTQSKGKNEKHSSSSPKPACSLKLPSCTSRDFAPKLKALPVIVRVMCRNKPHPQLGPLHMAVDNALCLRSWSWFKYGFQLQPVLFIGSRVPQFRPTLARKHMATLGLDS
jgi:hypothetical protein